MFSLCSFHLNFHQQLKGLWLTITALTITELLSQANFVIPTPTPLYLILVVYAAFKGGSYAGLTNAVLALFYALYYFSIPGQAFSYTTESFYQLVMLAIASLLMALMVGHLKRQIHQDLEQEVDEYIAKLATSQAQMQVILENTPAFVHVVGVDGCIKFVNAQWQELSERINQDPVDHHIKDFFSPVETAKFLEQNQLVATSGKSMLFESDVTFPDGSVRSYLEVKFPLPAAPGEVLSIAGIAVDVSDRKHLEAAFQQSQEQLARIFETIPNSITIVDLDGRITSANIYTENVLGWTLDHIKQLNYNDPAWQITTLDGQPFPDAELPFQRVMQSGESVFGVEHTLLRADGSRAIVSVNAAPLHDAEENVAGMVASTTDITKRKQLELQLHRRERELSDFLENGVVGLHWVGPDGTIIWANQAELELLGYSREEYVGHSICDFHADEEVINDILRRLTAQETLNDYEARLRCKDGSIKYVLIDSNVFWEENQFIHTRCFTRDITERKKAEEALQTSEERFRSLSACSPVGIFLTDTNGFATYVNPRWSAIAGLPPTAALKEGWVQGVHPDDRERVLSEWNTYTTVSDEEEYSSEFRFLAKGVVRWVHVRSSPVISDCGVAVGYVGTTEDITERKQTEEQLHALTQQLQQQNQQLEEISRLKSEFLTNMSHELRTPLTSILGFSSVLLQQHFGPLTSRQEQYLSVIHSSGDHLLNLINDLLDLAKIEAGRFELYIEQVSLLELCSDALEMVEVRALDKHQHLSLELPVACTAIGVDRKRVLQILLNYLSNAVKFTPNGGTITLTTHLASRQEMEQQSLPVSSPDLLGSNSSISTFLVISVRDTGVSIPAEKQHLLFRTFQQVDGSSDRSHEGTGLGLALTKRLVELHGGRVSFISSPGVGSTFSAWFPLPDLPAS